MINSDHIMTIRRIEMRTIVFDLDILGLFMETRMMHVEALAHVSIARITGQMPQRTKLVAKTLMML